MNYHHNVVAQNDHMFSYQPIPFFEDMKQENRSFNKKLDLNLYCIKRPQQTCFIRMTNPNMLAWGIEEGDMLVVEKNEELFLDELTMNFTYMSLLHTTTGNLFSYLWTLKWKILKRPIGENYRL